LISIWAIILTTSSRFLDRLFLLGGYFLITTVLCGKGYNVNQHKGNLYFRKLVSAVRNEYVVTPKDEKKFFAKKVLQHFRSLNPPVRFLKQAADNSPYVDIGEKLSLEKTRQALREGKPTIVRKLQSGELVIGKVRYQA
jgi:hypothetical protein